MKSNPAYLRYLTLAMLFMYFFNSFKTIHPFIVYTVNYKYISGVLCVNKDHPELQCNGKCHLKKELKKAGEDASEKKEVASGRAHSENLPAGNMDIRFRQPLHYIEKSTPVFITQGIISILASKSTPPPEA